MSKINLSDVAKKYNSVNVIWDKTDKWHFTTHRMIQKFVDKTMVYFSQNKKLNILNAGSAGNSYQLPENNITHVDIARDKISHLPNSVVSNIEKMPFTRNQFDLIICVGSVINYCDPIKVMEEFSRILNSKGHIIIEFENSHSFEFFAKEDFNKRAVMVNTTYNGSDEKIWYFSESFIKEIISSFNYDIVLTGRWHIVSGLVYRILNKTNFSAIFSILDSVFRFIPGINKYCSNVIYLLKKRE